MQCEIGPDLACIHCGRIVSHSLVKAECPAFGLPDLQGSQPPGLGDMVAAGLEAIGITKARVAAVMGVTDCGCNKRQQQLNALGRRLGIGATKPGGESWAGRLWALRPRPP